MLSQRLVRAVTHRSGAVFYACMLALAVSSASALAGCSGGGLSALSPGSSPQSGGASPTPQATATPGGPAIGAPSFPTGGSGNCTTGIFFTGTGQTAVIPLSEPGYTGAFTVAKNAAPTVASVTVSGSTATVTALANGTDFFSISDSLGGASGCNVNVTVTTGIAS